MNIHNPAEMREISFALAEQLAKYRFQNSNHADGTEYCAATAIDGAITPLRPLLLTGLKQAAESYDRKTRYWLTNTGKLLSLPDAQICAVNYIMAGDRYVLDVRPSSPISIPVIAHHTYRAQALKWGQSKHLPSRKVVGGGFNGHVTIIELNNGIHLETPNQHEIASWVSPHSEIAGCAEQQNCIIADLDKNEFQLICRHLHPFGREVECSEPFVAVSFSSLIEADKLASKHNLALPRHLKSFQYETVKMVSLEFGKNLPSTGQVELARLWNSIELFRIRRDSEILSPARYDSWQNLLCSALNTFQLLRLNLKSPYDGNMRNCLETIPNLLLEIHDLIKCSTIRESINLQRLDDIIRNFMSLTPGIYQSIIKSAESENQMLQLQCESRYGLHV